jgi:hypothetical protein
MPYKTLDELLRKCLTLEEDENTKLLIKRLKTVRKRGWLTKNELILVCRWKSARAMKLITSNHDHAIKTLTREALRTRSETRKIDVLTELNGVSMPMASALLMLTNPARYGVIDIRVWEVLFKLRAVTTKPRGTNFTFKEWYRLLMILRYFARHHKVSVRTIEHSIFLVHRRYQKGKLYR